MGFVGVSSRLHWGRWGTSGSPGDCLGSRLGSSGGLLGTRLGSAGYGGSWTGSCSDWLSQILASILGWLLWLFLLLNSS